jgi:hypothetical protein
VEAWMDPEGLKDLKVHHLEPKYYGFERAKTQDDANLKERTAVLHNSAADILTGPYQTNDWGDRRAAIQIRVNAKTLNSPYVFFRPYSPMT